MNEQRILKNFIYKSLVDILKIIIPIIKLHTYSDFFTGDNGKYSRMGEKQLRILKIVKKLVRESFIKYGNPQKPTEHPLWTSAYIIADKFDIPLIIQGENAALTLGVVNTGLGVDGNALNVNEGNTLAGCNASDWVDDETALNELYMYQFPNKKNLIDKGIKAIYLQYYAKE